MIRLILAGIALAACGYAIYTDFRYRYINDWLTWGLVGVGLVGHVLISLSEWSFTPVLYSLCAVAIFFGIANILFYAGAFGGGDVKLLIGLAATVSLYPAMLLSYVSPRLADYPFLVTVLVNILVIGAVYSVIYLCFKAAKHYEKFKRQFSKHFAGVKKLVYLCVGLLVVPIACAFFGWQLFIAASLFIGLCWLTVILIPFSKAVEKVMVYGAKPSELEAGDRPVSEIKVGSKLVYKPRRIGLTEDDVKRLQALEKLGKLGKINVKDGVPYAPAILLGLAFSLVLGDLFWIVISSLI